MVKCARGGLEVNAKKTVLMTSCTTTRAPMVVDGEEFKFVERAKYLGGEVSFPLDHRSEMEKRVQCGWMAWTKLSNLLTSRDLRMEMKRRLFDSCVTSVVLYGCETWALKEADKEALRVTQRKIERRMMGGRRWERWTNEALRRKTGVRDWAKEAMRRKLEWAWKIVKMDVDRWARRTTTWIPYTHVRGRTRGCPLARWRDDVRREAGAGWWSARDEEWKAAIAHHADANVKRMSTCTFLIRCPSIRLLVVLLLT